MGGNLTVFDVRLLVVLGWFRRFRVEKFRRLLVTKKERSWL